MVFWVLGRREKKPAPVVSSVDAKTQSAVSSSAQPGSSPASEFSKEIEELRQLLKDAKTHGKAPDRIGLTGFGELRWRNELVFYFADGSEGTSFSRHFGGAIKEGGKIVGVVYEGREYMLGNWSSGQGSSGGSLSSQSRMERGS